MSNTTDQPKKRRTPPPQKYTNEDLKTMQAWPLERKIQLTHPKQWEYCMKPINQGGLGLSVPLDYIGCPWKNEEEKTEASSPNAAPYKC